jgi:5-hydroxyisourate hydrolase
MSAITTHVLDTSRGRPAGGVPVHLDLKSGNGWEQLGHGVTDADGRLKTLLPAEHVLSRGVYRLTFQTGAYFAHHAVEGFYPEVSVVFEIREAGQHYHVPLLLNPFGYSTYRGS